MIMSDEAKIVLKLKDLGASEDLAMWFGLRKFKTAWGQCQDYLWMVWLTSRLLSKKSSAKMIGDIYQHLIVDDNSVWSILFPKEQRYVKELIQWLHSGKLKTAPDVVQMLRHNKKIQWDVSNITEPIFRALNKKDGKEFASYMAGNYGPPYLVCTTIFLDYSTDNSRMCSIIRDSVSWKALRSAAQKQKLISKKTK
jgi:hypothetical protein